MSLVLRIWVHNTDFLYPFIKTVGEMYSQLQFFAILDVIGLGVTLLQL